MTDGTPGNAPAGSSTATSSTQLWWWTQQKVHHNHGQILSGGNHKDQCDCQVIPYDPQNKELFEQAMAAYTQVLDNFQHMQDQLLEVQLLQRNPICLTFPLEWPLFLFVLCVHPHFPFFSHNWDITIDIHSINCQNLHHTHLRVHHTRYNSEVCSYTYYSATIYL